MIRFLSALFLYGIPAVLFGYGIKAIASGKADDMSLSVGNDDDTPYWEHRCREHGVEGCPDCQGLNSNAFD
jgi:hypothetical protein